MQQIFGPEFIGPIQQGGPTIGDWEGSVTFAEEHRQRGHRSCWTSPSASPTWTAPTSTAGASTCTSCRAAAAPTNWACAAWARARTRSRCRARTCFSKAVVFGTLSGGANGSSLSVVFNANATVDAVEELIQQLSYANTSQSPAASRVGGPCASATATVAPASAFAKTILITPEADGEPASVWARARSIPSWPAEQRTPAVAKLADGGYVVVWQSTQQVDTTSEIYFQRFNSSGVAVGPEMRVNTVTSSTQDQPHVAGLSNGGFVITWDDSSGSDSSGRGASTASFTTARASPRAATCWPTPSPAARSSTTTSPVGPVPAQWPPATAWCGAPQAATRAATAGRSTSSASTNAGNKVGGRVARQRRGGRQHGTARHAVRAQHCGTRQRQPRHRLA